MIVAPEGVEFEIAIYLTSDSTGIDTRLRVSGAKMVVDDINVEGLAKMSGLLEVAPDFRAMTREEIKTYKDNEEDEDARR